MEFELRRHDWASLRGANAEATVLPSAIGDLCRAADRKAAELALHRIERVMFAQGQLSEASVALASSLVHGLWRCSDQSLDLALGLLSDIASGFEDETDSNIPGSVTIDRCLFEVRAGFPIYVEVLESALPIDAKTACIDLILMCGLSDSRLRERAIFFLKAALGQASLADHQGVIRSSLAELTKSI
jgi:hypothetical protein